LPVGWGTTGLGVGFGLSGDLPDFDFGMVTKKG
jgi:hypothetical protein